MIFFSPPNDELFHSTRKPPFKQHLDLFLSPIIFLSVSRTEHKNEQLLDQIEKNRTTNKSVAAAPGLQNQVPSAQAWRGLDTWAAPLHTRRRDEAT